jgi:hypothetical protein
MEKGDAKNEKVVFFLHCLINALYAAEIIFVFFVIYFY